MAVLAIPRTARACTIVVRPLEDYSEEVAVAFFGREIEGREIGERVVLTFEVYRVYKGEVGPHIRFVEPGQYSPCAAYTPRGTTVVLAGLIEKDSLWYEAGDLVTMSGSSYVSEIDLVEVFGAGYPPDETILLPEDPPGSTILVSESSSNPTTIRQTVAIGIALVVLGAGLIAMHRRRQREER